MSTIIIPVMDGAPGVTTMAGVSTYVSANIDNYDEKATTIMALTSTMSSMLNGCAKDVQAAEAYLDSLSPEQMLELEAKLEQKETMMINGVEYDLTFDAQKEQTSGPKTK